ncbi:MAG: 16S rRNA (cytosine(1402)-N(4))-methyltransferase RsmH [Planctomycetota bacterium]
MKTESLHVPVLLEEVREALKVKRGDVVADVTVGVGGHAVPLLKAAGKNGRLIGLDLDPENLAEAQSELAKTKLRFDLIHANFAGLATALASLSLTGVDALVADLGVSSTQIDRAKRGFSFIRPAKLDMRMDPTRGKTAADVLAEIPEARLAQALRELGDEPDAVAIARTIATARVQRPVDTTARLVSLVCQAKGIVVPKRGWGRLHPAALAFQAVRMIVNRELENLQALLAFLPSCLRPGGRAAIISFHSGEDRLVKTSFKEGHARGLYSEISADAVRPSEEEEGANRRSWSARMRWAVRV